MNNQPVGASRIPKATWLGLFVAVFGMLIARQIAYYIWPTLTFTAAVWKESLIWLCVIALLVIIRRGERLPLTSVGIGTSPWWKSILWGLAMTIFVLWWASESLAPPTRVGRIIRLLRPSRNYQCGYSCSSSSVPASLKNYFIAGMQSSALNR